MYKSKSENGVPDGIVYNGVAILIFFLSIVVLILLHKYDNTYPSNTPENGEVQKVTEKQKGGFSLVELSKDEIDKKIDNKEKFILYIGRDTCPYCEVTKAAIEKWLREEATQDIYYFSTQESYDRMQNGKEGAEKAYRELKESLDFSTVPQLRIYKDDSSYEQYESLSLENYFDDDINEYDRAKAAYQSLDDIYTFLNNADNF